MQCCANSVGSGCPAATKCGHRRAFRADAKGWLVPSEALQQIDRVETMAGREIRLSGLLGKLVQGTPADSRRNQIRCPWPAAVIRESGRRTQWLGRRCTCAHRAPRARPAHWWDIQDKLAAAAMLSVWRIRGQWDIGIDLAKEEPRPALSFNSMVFCQSAKPCVLSECPLHDGSAIHKGAILASA